MRILLYSFEIFGKLKSNPSYDVGSSIYNLFDSESVDLIQLPVTFDCWTILKEKIDKFKPDFIIGFGFELGINMIKIEKIGLNFKHTKMPDNNGNLMVM
ncbi:MAG: hypothetical protein K0B02_03030 [DPANN group archaeon]|nr:hypothetical protein [DPANN group archaeon]